MNKVDRERVEEIRGESKCTMGHCATLSKHVTFLLSIIDKQEGRIRDLEEAYDDAFPYGWGGI